MQTIFHNSNRDGIWARSRTALGYVIVASLLALGATGCIFFDYGDVDRPELDLECGEFGGEEPLIGFYWDDYEPLGRGCDAIPIEVLPGGYPQVRAALWLPGSLVEGRTATVRLEARPDPEFGTVVYSATIPEDAIEISGGSFVEFPVEAGRLDEGERGTIELTFYVDFAEVTSEPVISDRVEIYR